MEGAVNGRNILLTRGRNALQAAGTGAQLAYGALRPLQIVQTSMVRANMALGVARWCAPLPSRWSLIDGQSAGYNVPYSGHIPVMCTSRLRMEAFESRGRQASS